MVDDENDARARDGSQFVAPNADDPDDAALMPSLEADSVATTLQPMPSLDPADYYGDNAVTPRVAQTPPEPVRQQFFFPARELPGPPVTRENSTAASMQPELNSSVGTDGKPNCSLGS